MVKQLVIHIDMQYVKTKVDQKIRAIHYREKLIHNNKP